MRTRWGPRRSGVHGAWGSGEAWRQSTRDTWWRHLRLALLAGALACPATAAGQTGYTFVQIAPGFSPAVRHQRQQRRRRLLERRERQPRLHLDPGHRRAAAHHRSPIITRFPVYDYLPKRLAINAQNVVAGQGLENGAGRAATYSATSGLVILGGGHTSATGRAINAAGVVVGTYRGNSTIPFVWRPGTGFEFPFSLGHPGGPTAADVNDAGVVVGTCNVGSGCAGQGTPVDTASTWTSMGGTRQPSDGLSSAPTVSDDWIAINSQGTRGRSFLRHDVRRVLLAPADPHRSRGTTRAARVRRHQRRGVIVATILSGGRTPYVYRNGTGPTSMPSCRRGPRSGCTQSTPSTTTAGSSGLDRRRPPLSSNRATC